MVRDRNTIYHFLTTIPVLNCYFISHSTQVHLTLAEGMLILARSLQPWQWLEPTLSGTFLSVCSSVCSKSDQSLSFKTLLIKLGTHASYLLFIICRDVSFCMKTYIVFLNNSTYSYIYKLYSNIFVLFYFCKIGNYLDISYWYLLE